MAQSAFDGQLGKRIASHLRGRREVQNNKHDKTMNHKMKKKDGLHITSMEGKVQNNENCACEY